MTHPDFARAAAYITAETVRDVLVELVDIASPTGSEAGVAHYLVERMRKSGQRPTYHWSMLAALMRSGICAGTATV
jgi:hypothetical protein